jgi:putative phage-type endonuclease
MTGPTLPPPLTGRWIGTHTPRSPEWHQARAGRIGGSDIGTICGWAPLDRNGEPYETPGTLLARKRGELPDKPSTDAMERGNYLEPAVAAWFADKTGATYAEEASKGSYVHPDVDWALCHPDRILTDGSLLEIKTAAEKNPEHGWGRQATDQVPLHYAAQATWQMWIMGANICHIAVLFGSPFKFAHYRVRRDPLVIEHIVAAATDFHHHMTREENAA